MRIAYVVCLIFVWFVSVFGFLLIVLMRCFSLLVTVGLCVGLLACCFVFWFAVVLWFVTLFGILSCCCFVLPTLRFLLVFGLCILLFLVDDCLYIKFVGCLVVVVFVLIVCCLYCVCFGWLLILFVKFVVFDAYALVSFCRSDCCLTFAVCCV